MANRFDNEPQAPFRASTEPTAAHPLKYASWLLIELERLLIELPAEDRQACLQEVEEHLACCRLALEEVGLDPSESDREAVRRFGSPETFAAQAILSRNPARGHSKFMVGATAAAILIALAWLMLGIFNMALVWPLGICSVAALAVCSWNYRLQLKSVMKGGLLATLFLAVYIGFAYINLRDFGDAGIMPRWQVPGMKADAEKTLALYDQALAQCEPIQMAFQKGEAAVKQTPFYSGAYLAFVVTPQGASGTPIYKIVKVNDFRQAASSWENYKNNFRSTWSANTMEAVSNSVAANHTSESAFSLAMAGQGAQAGFFLTLLSLCLNFAVFVFRLLWERARTPRKRLVA
jgi:uncharacterized membrane protein